MFDSVNTDYSFLMQKMALAPFARDFWNPNGLSQTNPLLIGFRVFDQLSDGVEAVYSSFNGFRELVKRPEAVDILSELYQEELEKLASLDFLLKH